MFEMFTVSEKCDGIGIGVKAFQAAFLSCDDPEDEYDAENNYDNRNYDSPDDDDGGSSSDREFEFDDEPYDDRWTIIDRNDFV